MCNVDGQILFRYVPDSCHVATLFAIVSSFLTFLSFQLDGEKPDASAITNAKSMFSMPPDVSDIGFSMNGFLAMGDWFL